MTWALATIAVLVIAYAAVSKRLQQASVSSAIFFTTTGLLAGPALGLLDLEVESEQVKVLAEITLTLVLFADASRISLRALRREFAVPLRLLGIALPLTIAAGTLAGALVIPGVSVAEALVLAVVLTCTDAALGQAVVIFGALILGPLLDELTWQVMLYAVLSLSVVRMLPVALAMLGTGARRQTVAFLGWFGPRGLASIVFAVILLDDADLPHLQSLLLAIAVTIAISVYVHGFTAGPLTERYVRWWSCHPRHALPQMESTPAGEHRWRVPTRDRGAA